MGVVGRGGCWFRSRDPAAAPSLPQDIRFSGGSGQGIGFGSKQDLFFLLVTDQTIAILDGLPEALHLPRQPSSHPCGLGRSCFHGCQGHTVRNTRELKMKCNCGFPSHLLESEKHFTLLNSFRLNNKRIQGSMKKKKVSIQFECC